MLFLILFLFSFHPPSRCNFLLNRPLVSTGSWDQSQGQRPKGTGDSRKYSPDSGPVGLPGSRVESLEGLSRHYGFRSCEVVGRSEGQVAQDE